MKNWIGTVIGAVVGASLATGTMLQSEPEKPFLKVDNTIRCGQLDIFNLEGKTVVRLGATKDGNGYATLFNADGKETGRLPLSARAIAASRPVGHNYTGDLKGHYIDENIKDGTFILLDDDSLWEVDPLDRSDCSLWMRMSDVIILEGDDLRYPYKIISKDDDEVVKARFVQMAR